jgi:hypothetical protein
MSGASDQSGDNGGTDGVDKHGSAHLAADGDTEESIQEFPLSALSEHSFDLEMDSASDSGTSVPQEKQLRRSAEKQQKELAARETRYVRRLKVIVVVALFLSMVAVSLSAYFFSASQEQKDFQDQFHDDAVKVLSTMGTNIDRTLLACDAFCVSVSSFAKSTGQIWPYVVVPDFAVRAEKVRSLANAIYAMTYHLVQDDQREDWQEYAAAVGPTQVNESVAAIEDFQRMDWPIIWNYTTWNVIHGYDEWDYPDPGTHGVNYSGPYLPMWQIQPNIPNEPPYNWDLMSAPKVPSNGIKNADVVLDTRRVVFSQAYFIATGDPDRDKEDIDEANWLKDYLPNVDTVQEVMHPISGKCFSMVMIAASFVTVNGYDTYIRIDSIIHFLPF